jgi:hypothetical protein
MDMANGRSAVARERLGFCIVRSLSLEVARGMTDLTSTRGSHGSMELANTLLRDVANLAWAMHGVSSGSKEEELPMHLSRAGIRMLLTAFATLVAIATSATSVLASSGGGHFP